MHSFIVLSVFVLAVSAVPAISDIPEPGQLALVLGEEEFEDYLDEWLAKEQLAYNGTRTASRNGGCVFRVNGDLGQPQPVYLRHGDYLQPTGNTGLITLQTGEEVLIACPGNTRILEHPNRANNIDTAFVSCVTGNLISSPGWLSGKGEFVDLTCSGNAVHTAEYTGERCYNNNRVIRVGFIVQGVFYPKLWSCYDEDRMEVLYVWYEQNPQNGLFQTGVARPTWAAGSFYPGVGINNLYTQVQQKATIAELVGNDLADKYVTPHQFLARGHLAAKTDYIYATGQRSTFYFINAAPQWQPFNAGNWNWLEQNLRVRIGVAGYKTTVYTGTFGVSQLRDQNNRLVDVYLHSDANNNPQLPVPLYFYKVVYDASRRIGTAFVSINNPYYTEEEVRALTFCTDRCRNNAAFNWLNWQPDRIDIGYSFCCEIGDFRRTVRHLPDFSVNGLLS